MHFLGNMTFEATIPHSVTLIMKQLVALEFPGSNDTLRANFSLDGALMDGLITHETPDVKLPTMIVAFAGWPDAAEAATRAIRYLVRKLPAKKIAEIDPEEFYDFTEVRPQTRVNRKGERVIRWPRNDFYSFTPDDPQRVRMGLGDAPLPADRGGDRHAE